MKRILFWLHKGRLAAVALAWWALCTAPAWAKPPTPAATESSAAGESKAWLVPYSLVLLAVGLGMLVVCRSSRRSDRAKPKAYEASEDTKKK